MGTPGAMRPIDHAILRFPARGEAIRLAYLQDERFRAICEDLDLALASLRRFEARPDADRRPEIDEYRTVLRELEDELREYLGVGDGSG